MDEKKDQADRITQGIELGVSANVENEYRPIYPRHSPPYKVHWNWEIMLPCNFRCSYCVVHNEKSAYLKLPVDEWEMIWKRIFVNYGCCQVRFAGGEPTIYPDFIRLVSRILRYHTVDITTNLSFDVDEWIARVPGEGIAVSGSLHLEHFTPENFLKKLLKIRAAGNRLISACLVAHPRDISRIADIRQMFENERVLFKIIPLNGSFNGKRYPDGYTDEERGILGMQVEKSADHLGKTLNRQWQDFANTTPIERNFEGVACHMGEMYAKIYSDGTVRRCCHTDTAILGHITDTDLRLFDEPVPCNVPSCSCWKAMVVGKYEEKVDTLWQSADHPDFPARAPGV